MSLNPSQMPELIKNIIAAIESQSDAITELDQAIGDGDHVFNLLRGLHAIRDHANEISGLDWPDAWQKIGMTVMAAVGGASGSLYATLFISLSKNARDKILTLQGFSQAFQAAVEAVKQRGKADIGEKTMLDVLVPVSSALHQAALEAMTIEFALDKVCTAAELGVESTRDMLATKGRASFLGERSLGHIDAGAKTAQIMIAAIAQFIKFPGQESAIE